MLTVEHVITADSATGEPWPPSDNEHYCAVRHAHGFTLWRKLTLEEETVITTNNNQQQMRKSP